MRKHVKRQLDMLNDEIEDYHELMSMEDTMRFFHISRSKMYTAIKSGLLPPPIKVLGTKTSRELKGELREIRERHVAGEDENQIRQLVSRQVANRRKALQKAPVSNQPRKLAQRRTPSGTRHKAREGSGKTARLDAA